MTQDRRSHCPRNACRSFSHGSQVNSGSSEPNTHSLSLMKQLTRHHLVPDSMGGTYHPENIRMINEKSHRNFHMVFSNRTPIAQIRQLTQFNASALSNDVKNKLIQLLEPYT